MVLNNEIWVASTADKKICILPKMANRHGLIAGATGTGKTITLKVLAESLSDLGVPVFLSDVKGDLSGMSVAGIDSENLQKRIKKLGIENFSYNGKPSVYWDLYGEKGHQVRATISQIGPTLLSRILDLNNVQEGVLYIIFRVADDNGWLLLDTKDLRAMLQYVSDNAQSLSSQYGNISKTSIGAISRALLVLEDNGGKDFFGEPALDIFDWIKCVGESGNINILDSTKLANNGKLYSTFLLWMLTELYERLPEVGDIEKPKMVFFFDEAHLLFSNITKSLLEKVEQVVKLIRSKGVGIYFITQNPADIPNSVLVQLGNKIQHALRAYTPTEQKAVKVAANSFRENPKFNTEEAISELEIGEALVSFLDNKGKPEIVERAFILPPQSLMGEIDENIRKEIISKSIFGSKYDTIIDRESAYEILNKRFLEEENRKNMEIAEKERVKAEKEAQKAAEAQRKEEARIAREKARNKSPFEKIATSVGRQAMNTATRKAANSLIRGILGTLLGGKKK